MKKLSVFYDGWGEHWQLGTLADDGRQLLFEYSPAALRQGLELSPYCMKLRPQAYGDFPAHLQRLPGFIADALPDGWGKLLMDRVFRRSGLTPDAVSPLDGLAFVSGHAMGALSFEPASTLDAMPETVRLLDIAHEVQVVVAGAESEALMQLALMGGSPHGARPKVLVHHDPLTGAMSTAPFASGVPWLVKFQAQNEHKEVCAVEAWYADLARACGLDIPATRAFDLSDDLGAFGIERFDVERGLRVPVLTLAGLLHADFRTPSLSYIDLLRATRFLTRDEREVFKAFERAVFNVLFNNRDDHSKNFSYRLGEDRRWQLSPCYDLTFNEGPVGEHQMDVQGKGRNIDRHDLLALARQGGLPLTDAARSIDRMVSMASDLKASSDGKGIRPSTLEHIGAAVAANHRLLLASS